MSVKVGDWVKVITLDRQNAEGMVPAIVTRVRKNGDVDVVYFDASISPRGTGVMERVSRHVSGAGRMGYGKWVAL
jgi:hypothetical protein